MHAHAAREHGTQIVGDITFNDRQPLVGYHCE